MSIPLSKACCSSPAVVREGYEQKGHFTTFDNLKTYVTGSTSAKMAILYAYDAFAFTSQTLQGADMLAAMADCLVLMPDFLDGGIPREAFPADTPEKEQIFVDFFAGKGDWDRVTKLVTSSVKAIKSAYPSVEKIAGLGFCYGGKVSICAANQPDTPFNAIAQAHPARLAKEDAEALRVPHLCLASNEEDPEDVKAFDAVAKPPGSETYTYEKMHHGWMGGRADFNNELNVQEFTRGYKQVAEWFKRVI